MGTINIKYSEIFLFFGGISLLVSLPFLAEHSFTLWAFAKILYGIGVGLFLFDQ